MFKIKGSALNIAVAVAKKHSPNTYHHFISSLHKKYNVQTIYPNKWYELSSNEKDSPVIALAHHLFPDDPLAIRKLGALQVHEGTKKFHYFFLRVASPRVVFSRAVNVWATFYDTGQFELEFIQPNTFVLHIRHFPEMPSYLREIIYGSLESLSALMHRAVSITHDDSSPDHFTWTILCR